MSARQFQRRRCISPDTISKPTFLAMLGDPPGKSFNTQQEVSDSKIRAYFENLNDDQWQILTFNAETRDVCVEVISPAGSRTMTVTLPYLSNSKP